MNFIFSSCANKETQMELKSSKNRPKGPSLCVCACVCVTFISLNLSLTETQPHEPDECQKGRATHTSGHLETQKNQSRKLVISGRFHAAAPSHPETSSSRCVISPTMWLWGRSAAAGTVLTLKHTPALLKKWEWAQTGFFFTCPRSSGEPEFGSNCPDNQINHEASKSRISQDVQRRKRALTLGTTTCTAWV